MLCGKRIQDVIFQAQNRFLVKVSKDEGPGALDVEALGLNITLVEVCYPGVIDEFWPRSIPSCVACSRVLRGRLGLTCGHSETSSQNRHRNRSSCQ